MFFARGAPDCVLKRSPIFPRFKFCPCFLDTVPTGSESCTVTEPDTLRSGTSWHTAWPLPPPFPRVPHETAPTAAELHPAWRERYRLPHVAGWEERVWERGSSRGREEQRPEIGGQRPDRTSGGRSPRSCRSLVLEAKSRAKGAEMKREESAHAAKLLALSSTQYSGGVNVLQHLETPNLLPHNVLQVMHGKIRRSSDRPHSRFTSPQSQFEAGNCWQLRVDCGLVRRSVPMLCRTFDSLMRGSALKYFQAG